MSNGPKKPPPLPPPLPSAARRAAPRARAADDEEDEGDFELDDRELAAFGEVLGGADEPPRAATRTRARHSAHTSDADEDTRTRRFNPEALRARLAADRAQASAAAAAAPDPVEDLETGRFEVAAVDVHEPTATLDMSAAEIARIAAHAASSAAAVAEPPAATTTPARHGGSGAHRRPTPPPRMSAGLFRYGPELEGQLRAIGLDGHALRLAVELTGELEAAAPERRALCAHAIAEAVRTAPGATARTLASELDRMAIDLAPDLLPAHQALVADAWRAGDWALCAERMGLLATQLEEMAGEERRMRSALPSLYVQLELLLERRVRGQETSHLALTQHALSLSAPQQLLAALNAARFALVTGDVAGVTAAYERLVEESPAGLREAFAIDLVTWLWRERGNVEHAIAACHSMRDADYRTPAHLAALQLLAWEGGERTLEAQVTGRWIEYLEDALERLGRSDLQRRRTLTRRIAALYQRAGELAAARGDTARAEESLARALELEPDALYFNQQAELRAALAGDHAAATAALERQIAAVHDPVRRALLGYRFATQGQLERGLPAAQAITLLENALRDAPDMLAALAALRRMLLRERRYPACVALEQRLSTHASDPIDAAIAHAERLENLLDADEAFDAWFALGPELAYDNYFVLRALVRSGLRTGRYEALAALYRAAAEAQADPHRRRDLAWKHSQLVTRVVGTPDEAVAAQLEFLQEAPDDLRTLDALAQLLIERDRPAQAIEVIERLLELTEDPRERRALLETRADLLEEAGCDAERLQSALAPLRELDPDNACAEFLTRRSLLERADWAGLEAWCLRHVEHAAPGSASRRVRLLEAAFVATTQSREPGAGRRLVERLLEEEPHWPPALDLNEEFLLATGAWPELVELLVHRAEAPRTGRGDPEERARLLEQAASLALDRLDDEETAHALFERALAAWREASAGEAPDDEVCWRALLDSHWRARDLEGLAERLTARLTHDSPLAPAQRREHLRELALVAETLERDELLHQALAPLLEAERDDGGEDLFALRALQRLARRHGDAETRFALLGRIAYTLARSRKDHLHYRLAQWRLGQMLGQPMMLEGLAELITQFPSHALLDAALDQQVHARPPRAARPRETLRALIEVLDLRSAVDEPIEEALRLEQLALLNLELAADPNPRGGGDLKYDETGRARAALTAVIGLCPEHLAARFAVAAIDDGLDALAEAAYALEQAANHLEPGPHRSLVLQAAIQRWRAAGEPRRADALQAAIAPGDVPRPGLVFDPTDADSRARIYEAELERTTHEVRRGLLHVTLARTLEAAAGGAPVAEAWPHWRQAARHIGQTRTVRLALVRYAALADIAPSDERAVLFDELACILERDELTELLLAEAERLDADGHPTRAIATLERLLTAHPGERAALELLADLAQGSPATVPRAVGALEALRQVTRHTGLRTIFALEAAALLELRLGDRAGAIEMLREGLSDAPDEPQLLGPLARLELAERNFAAAAHARLAESRHRTPRVAEACLHEAARLLGRRLFNHRAAGAAIERFTARPSLRLRTLHRELCTVAGEPDPVVGQRLVDASRTPGARARALWLLGLSHGDPGRAMDLMARALEADASYTPAALTLELLARQHARLDLLAVALTATARTTREPMLLVEAGRLLERIGSFEAAEHLYQQAAELSPADRTFGPFGPGEVLRRSYSRRGLVGLEIEHLFAMLQRDMSSVRRLRLQDRVADLLVQEDRLDEAIDAWRAVLELAPDDGYAFDTLGLLLAARGQHDALASLRKREIERVADRDPERAVVLAWELGEWLARRGGDEASGIALLEDTLERAPGFRPVWDSLQRLYSETGAWQAQIALLQRELAVAGPDRQAPLAFEIAQLHELRGHPEDALEACLATLEYSDVGHLHLAAADAVERLTRALGQDEAHIDALRTLTEREPDEHYRALCALRLGERLEVAGDHDGALAAYQQASHQSPGEPWTSFAWERCCVSLGERATYDAWLAAAIEPDPQGPQTIEFLARRVFVAEGATREQALLRLIEREPEERLGLIARLRSCAQAGDFAQLAATCHTLAHATWDASARQTLLESALVFASVLDDEQPPDALQWELLEGDPDNRSALVRMLGQRDPASDPQSALRIAGSLALAASGNREEAVQLTTMALWLCHTGDVGSARHSLDEALRREPGMLAALELRRVVAEADGDATSLVLLSVRQAELMTRNDQAQQRFMEAAHLCRDRLDRAADAIRLCRAVLATEPRHQGAFALLERIYAERNMRSELHDLMVSRAEAVEDIAQQKQLLARAADIARAAGSVHEAIENWRQLIARDPDDLESYRGMAAFCIENEAWEEAVEALRALGQRSRDHEELAGAWLAQGELLSDRLGRHAEAIPVYRQLLRARGNDTHVLGRLADLYQLTAQHDQCLEILEQMVPLQYDLDSRKDVLERIFNGQLEWFQAPSRAQQTLLEFRALDSSDLRLLTQLAEWLRTHDQEAERQRLLASSFEHYRDEYLAGEGRVPLRSMLAIADLLGARDRSFVMGSLLVASGAANANETQTFARAARQAARRPERVPEATLKRAQSAALSGALLDIMRNAERFLARSGPHMAHAKAIARKYRITPEERAEIGVLEPHARALGVELPAVYLLPQASPLPTLAMLREPAIVLTEAELDANTLVETRYRVAIGAAGLSLGCAHFSTATFPEFRDMLVGLARAVLPNQRLALKITNEELVENVARAVPKKAREVLSNGILQIARGLTDDSAAFDYHALQLTCLRYALVTMRDPAPAIEVVAQLEGSGRFPFGGTMREILRFVASDDYLALRRESGVAVE